MFQTLKKKMLDAYSSLTLHLLIMTCISIFLSLWLFNLQDPLTDPWDLWYIYAINIRNKILDWNYDMAPFLYELSWQPHLPFFAFISALLLFIVGDAKLSCILVSIFSVMLTLLYLREFAIYIGLKDEVNKILIVYISSYTVISNIARPMNDSLAAFFSVVSLFYIYRSLKTDLLKEYVILSIILTLSVLTKDSLFPLLLVPISFYLLTLLKMKENMNAEILGKLILFTILIPFILWLSFVLSLDLLPVILNRRIGGLERLYSTARSPFMFIFSIIVCFHFLPILVFSNYKVFRNQKYWILLIWLFLFIIARIIAPGPFWDRLWLPGLFSAVILGCGELKSNKLYEISPKLPKILFILMIAVNYSVALLFIMYSAEIPVIFQLISPIFEFLKRYYVQ
ncbi:glycosyltransferase family 39 protein [Candidatus Borrarchaeum sp.]|uniref:glycosyltransferase family 39 protein n=1 Tax=Candidatus Borrarchaeum sp. TaxID=2846742 RepID=UPI002580D929|nr:glycosyltransferase family 39 protein [Candidatus Borrarchaeum sp.]